MFIIDEDCDIKISQEISPTVKPKSIIFFHWYGEYPPIYHLTVRSACQSGIDKIILIGDKPPKIYDNMEWFNFRFEDLFKLIRNIIPSFNSDGFTPYKICDYRPLFYYMYSQVMDLSQYDYWMYNDLDAMVGNFDLILRKLKNKNYHALSSNPYWFGGNFQLYSTSIFKDNKSVFFDIFNKNKNFFEGNYKGADEMFMHKLFLYLKIPFLLDRTLERQFVDVGHNLDNCPTIYDGKNLIRLKEPSFVWTLHFIAKYKTIPFINIDKEIYESNYLLIDIEQNIIENMVSL